VEDFSRVRGERSLKCSLGRCVQWQSTVPVELRQDNMGQMELVSNPSGLLLVHSSTQTKQVNSQFITACHGKGLAPLRNIQYTDSLRFSTVDIPGIIHSRLVFIAYFPYQLRSSAPWRERMEVAARASPASKPLSPATSGRICTILGTVRVRYSDCLINALASYLEGDWLLKHDSFFLLFVVRLSHSTVAGR